MFRSAPLVLFVLLAASPALFAQTSFVVPLYITAAKEIDTLHYGVNPGNTIGIDDAAAFGSFRETMAPPTPPPPFAFDARFVTLPGRVSLYPTGLGTGTYRDIRDFKSSAQIDSFKIKIDGDLTENGDVVVSWPNDLKNYASAWIIKPQAGSDWPATDMLTATSVTIPAGTQKNIIIIKTGALVSDAEHAAPPASFALGQSHPNPFSASTAISFSLPSTQHARIEIYNLLGVHVSTLLSQVLPAGAHSVEFHAGNLPSGVYLYRLETPGFIATRRMHITR
jgi:hypothetical protein